MPSSPKKSKPYEAREFWEPSPSPTEDYGSDKDRDWPFEIVGEEVGYGGKIKYEVAWEGWMRKDGTNTTWEGTDTLGTLLPTQKWEAQRRAALPNTPDIEIWGTTDIVNNATRERKQGYKESTPREQAAFALEYKDMKKRMEELMADKRRRFPELVAQAEAASDQPSKKLLPHRRPDPPRPHVNAEAGPSRPRPPVAAPAVSTSRTPPIPPRLRMDPPSGAAPLRPPSRQATSPTLSAVSISSSDSIIMLSGFPSPPKSPTIKRKATSPPTAASPPPLIRRRSNLPPVSKPNPPVAAASSFHFPVPSGPTAAASSSKSAPNASYAALATLHPLPSRHARPRPPPPPLPPPLPSFRKGSSSAPYSRAVSNSTSATSTSTSTAYSFHRRAPASRRIDSDSDSNSESSAPSSPAPVLRSSRRGLKRKATADEDEDEDEEMLGLKCACGTLLPPPDMRGRRGTRTDLCESCRASETRNSSVTSVGKKTAGGAPSPAASRASTAPSAPSNGVNAMRRSSTASVGKKTAGGAPSRAASRASTVPSASSVRKGKARENPKSLRLRIETAWSEAAHASAEDEGGAAGIRFVNEVDDEEVPPSISGPGWEFTYLEDAYELPEILERYPILHVNRDPLHPLTERGRLIYCDCKPDDCTDQAVCSCQVNSVMECYAYTDGLFNFQYERWQVVIECNPYCLCSVECPNRVIQRPRKIPIEVFKTKRCGWGVRASVDVERGRMLGVYTGKLIPREEAVKLQGEEGAYCFDLDYNDNEQDEDMLFSVDSMRSGNWTRFINHSCAPNLRTQPVVYNTDPYQNVAFLAFVALKFIPAGTEFTFDYDPDAEQDFIPEGAVKCRCGAKECRGWVRTE